MEGGGGGGGGWYTSHSFAMRKPPCSMWSFHLVTKPHVHDAVILQSQTRRLFLKSHLSIHDVVPLFQDRKPSSRWYRTSSLWNCSLIPWCSSPFRDGDPPNQLIVPSILWYKTFQSILMFLHSMIQSLPVHDVVPPFHYKHTLNLSNYSQFHDTESPSSWCWSLIPDLLVHNAIPPFHGTEPPSSWYYSPIPWRCPAILW